ncbi:MAG TPA: hypothetical protein VHR66_08180 [Gemmataceae bacterium]|nr:hypothetical protein [Gemmataceae bacterium]
MIRFINAVIVVAILFACPAAFAADAKGKVKSVNVDRHEVAMVDDAGKSWTITAAKDCKVSLNGRDSKLEDLQSDDEITITYQKDGDKLLAQSIRATRK